MPVPTFAPVIGHNICASERVVHLVKVLLLHYARQESSQRRPPVNLNNRVIDNLVTTECMVDGGLQSQRGMIGLSPGNDYDHTGKVAERLAFANQQVFVTVMLETAGAFDHLDAIAAMDGIDALTLGPGDLAQNLGVFGTPDQARVLDDDLARALDACGPTARS